MTRYKYIKLPIKVIPSEIINQYNLLPLVHTDDHVYIEIRKGMYSLPQASCIANDQLQQHLAKYGYRHRKVTNSLWTHKTRYTKFTLVVDNFGLKYTSAANINHLLNALKYLYKITIDWTGSHFIGINLEWDYTNRICKMSMKDYVCKALARFNFIHRQTLHAPSLQIVCFGKTS